MAEKKHVSEENSDQAVVDRAKDFWTRYSKPITIGAAVLVLGLGAWLGYRNFVKEPNEQKAADAMFKAEEYYRQDSLQKALNGDGANLGLERVISRYGGTEAGELARFMAGDIYVRMGNPAKAISHLKEFDTDSKPLQARAYKLLGDAYADQGKQSDALSSYKKAARHWEDDEANASEYLFLAAYYAQRVMKNTKEATELYKEIKEKYPNTEKAYESEKFLAQLGVYDVEEK